MTSVIVRTIRKPKMIKCKKCNREILNQDYTGMIEHIYDYHLTDKVNDFIKKQVAKALAYFRIGRIKYDYGYSPGLNYHNFNFEGYEPVEHPYLGKLGFYCPYYDYREYYLTPFNALEYLFDKRLIS